MFQYHTNHTYHTAITPTTPTTPTSHQPHPPHPPHPPHAHHAHRLQGPTLDDATLAQMERRNRRKLQALSANQENNKTQDAGAFQRGYKRVVGGKSTVRGANKDPLMEQEELIKNHWSHLPQSDDGMVALDIDLLEDIVESTGILLPDKEAREALEWMPANQLGWYNLAGVLHWWRKRAADAEETAPLVWQERLIDARSMLRGWRSEVMKVKEAMEARYHWSQREELKEPLENKVSHPTPSHPTASRPTPRPLAPPPLRQTIHRPLPPLNAPSPRRPDANPPPQRSTRCTWTLLWPQPSRRRKRQRRERRKRPSAWQRRRS